MRTVTGRSSSRSLARFGALADYTSVDSAAASLGHMLKKQKQTLFKAPPKASFLATHSRVASRAATVWRQTS